MAATAFYYVITVRWNETAPFYGEQWRDAVIGTLLLLLLFLTPERYIPEGIRKLRKTAN